MAEPVPAPIPDAEARARALDTTASFVVEAPAGSGKTGLLIQRFLRLLASESVSDPAEVLAITFTRKATAEMHDRVFAQLAETGTGTEPSSAFDRATRPLAEAVLAKSEKLAWNLLGNPRLLNIRTIDSVCAEIARGLPILSGSGGGLAPTEDASRLHAEAARRTLMLLGETGSTDPALHSALESLLVHRDGNLGDCEALIAGMLATRDQWGELIPLSGAELTDSFLDMVVLPRFDRALELAVCRALTRLTRLVPAPILAQLSALAAEMAEAEGYQGAANPVALCRDRNRPPTERAEDLDHWRALIHLLVKPSKPRAWRKALDHRSLKFKVLDHHKSELKEIIVDLAAVPDLIEELCRIEALPPAQYPRDQWPTAKSLFRVLARALVELQLVFAANQQSDFTEAALEARSALRRPGALEDLRSSRTLALQHLLVDEMQDTSSSQYELILLLTQSWDGHSQTVFLVGDPKQSIYLFRQARVERFVRTMHSGRLGDLPVEPLHLTANFRSQRPLVEAFNTTFAALFPTAPDPTRPELVPYREAQAIRPASVESLAPPGTQHWHTTILPHTSDHALAAELKQTQARADAAAIRDLILQQRAQHPSQTIAVLVRNRNHLLEIVAALKTAPAIAYRAVNIEPLGERREILDLLALTRALLHPADRTAWLALLRTPWVGLTLFDLHLLAGGDDPHLADVPVLRLLASRGDLLSPDGIARLEPFWPIITAALAQRTRQPLARTVERTWRAFHAHLYCHPGQLENINRYLQLLDELEAQSEAGQGTVDLATLTTRLAKLYAATPPIANAVDLSTIHNSKGLEWDVVFVLALGRLGRNSQGRLLSWLETDAGDEADNSRIAPGILAPIQPRGRRAHELTAWMNSIENNRAAAERTRLFYVACTRAREQLHLFATVSRKANDDLSPTANTLLAAAWNAARPHFEHEIALPLPATLDLAAAAEPAFPRVIERIPLKAHDRTSKERALLQENVRLFNRAHSTRPEGSLHARIFGNTLHAFLEQAARQMDRGTPSEDILAELPEWRPRIAAVLRSSGLSPVQSNAFTAEVLRGLTNTLTSPDGLWLLSPHPEAKAESSLTAAGVDAAPRTFRLDRTFLAGPAPSTYGSSHLWIVDYKTTAHGRESLASFFAREEEKYRAQLEAYAGLFAHQLLPIRIALFYPMLPHLHVPAPARQLSLHL